MTLYKIEEVSLEKKGLHFRKMTVESGHLYNFWDVELDDYNKEWVFVPNI